MRQDRKSLSLMDMPDLPVEAFRHVGDRKIKLHGGGNPISDLIDGVGDAISSIGSAIDDMVHDIIPGGWAGVAAIGLLAAGVYDPELLAAADEGTLTTGMLENAGYDGMTVANSVAATSPEVTAATQAALSSGVSPEMIAMANASADPIAALNAAAGWTTSDAAYLSSIGYTGMITDPVTGAQVSVANAEHAEGAGWKSATSPDAPGSVWQDAHGTYYDASGNVTGYTVGGQVMTPAEAEAVWTSGPMTAAPPPVAPPPPSLPPDTIVSSVPTSQGGVSGVQVTNAAGDTWFEPAGANAPVAPSAPLTTTASGQPIVAGTEIGHQIPGAYSVDSAGVYYDVNGQVVATTQANGAVVAPNGLQYIEPTITAPANTIPVTLSDGSVGAFDPATGTVYNSAGGVDAGATQTMQTAQAGGAAGPGTQLAEAAKDTGVVSDAPFRVEVTGAAGTAETPSYAIQNAMTPGSQLATQAEIDAGTATWNPAANAWEVTATPAELSPVVPGEVGTVSGVGAGAGAGTSVVNPATGLLETVTPGANGVASVVLSAPEAAAATAGLTATQIAALGGAAAAAAAVASMGAGGAAAAANQAIATGGVPTTGPVAPGPTGPATVITPTGDVVPTTTTPPTQPPLTPPQTEVIPPGSSTVTPVEAPPAGITTPEAATNAGFDPATIAKWVAAGYIASKVLTPPATPSPGGYGPLNKHYPFGTADKMVNPGLNPGWITAQPFYQTTSPVQAQYYWGNHPYAETPADLANYNAVPYAPKTPWGLQQPQAPFDVNTYIRQTMTPQQQAALAGTAPQYYAPIAPATPAVGGKV